MSKTPVSILQEMMVKQGMIPDYELIHDGGGRHVNTFTYRVSCDGLSATGTGRCKKDAKHEAAKAMLTEIAAHRNYPQLPAASTPTVSPSMSPFHSAPPLPKTSANVPFFNAVGELQELCAVNNLQEPEYILIKDVGPPHARIFTIQCKISNFEEDGTATTKKQAKHDAAKRMIDRIKGLVNSSNDAYKEKDEEDLLKASITTVDTELLTKHAQECYRAFITSRNKINLGIKMDEYHIKFRESLETDKRVKVLEQLECIFPNEFFKNEIVVTDELIIEKLSELESVLSEIDIKINLRNVNTKNPCVIKLIQFSTCPPLTQFGIGRDNVEATWKALCQMIKCFKSLLS